MASDDPVKTSAPGGNRARIVALVLMAIMAVLLVFALFWNPLSVK